MNIEEKRQAWEMEKWIWKWIAISTGVVGFILVFLTAYLQQMGLFDLALVVVIAGGVGQLIYFALEGLLSRLRTDRAGSALSNNSALAAGVVLVLALLVGQAYAGFAGFFGYFVIGASVVAFGNTFMKCREVSVPRAFVQIENDGNVLALKCGESLLHGLEAAGYRLLTQCGAQGDCATCRVNLAEANQKITSENHGPVLTPRQQNEGWVIACRLPVQNDMKVKLFRPLVLRWPGFRKHEMTAKMRELRTALPGFDCEACGYGTCNEYAVAIARGEVSTSQCLPGGDAVGDRLDDILSESEAEVSNA